jgi:hypothetical protein
MHAASHYREEAEHMRRLLLEAHQPEINNLLHRLAQSYEEIAADLDSGAIEIVNPDRLPQCEAENRLPGDSETCDPDRTKH